MHKFLKRVLSFSLVFCILTSCQIAFAEGTDKSSKTPRKMVKAEELKSSEENLSEKDSIIKFIKKHPECKENVMQILKSKGALNPDNSIKNDLGRATYRSQNSSVHTGYSYDLESTMYNNDLTFAKSPVWEMTNESYNTPLECTMNQTYTNGVEVGSSTTIGSSLELEKAFTLSASVTFSYKYSESTSTQYGVKLILPKRTSGKIEANPYATLYGFREKYYVLGTMTYYGELIVVSKPTAVHWYYSERAL